MLRQIRRRGREGYDVSLSVTVVCVEADLYTQRLGQFVLVQTVQGVDIAIQGIELLASGFVGKQDAERLVEPGQVLTCRGIGRLDAAGQFCLIVWNKVLQAFVRLALPELLSACDGGIEAVQRGIAAPGFGLERLRIALGLAAERGAELFLQAVQRGDLYAKDVGNGLCRFGIALIGKVA